MMVEYIIAWLAQRVAVYIAVAFGCGAAVSSIDDDSVSLNVLEEKIRN